MKKVMVCVVLFLCASFSAAQETPFEGTTKTIEIKGDLTEALLDSIATENAGGSGVVWIGYQVSARRPLAGMRNLRSGHWRKFRGMQTDTYQVPLGERDDGIWLSVSGEKAVLYKYSRGAKGYRLEEAMLFDVKEEISFSKPMLWLGRADEQQSLTLLSSLFAAADDELREDLLPLIAVHHGEKPLDMLERIALSKADEDIREDAVIWFGLAIEKDEFDRFDGLFSKLDLPNLREDSLHIYYSMSDDRAVSRLFEIAGNDSSSGVREQAIFWLGQKVGKLLEREMGGSGDELSRDEKSKIFALHQIDNARSRGMLMKVAREGKSAAIRKQALFWLCTDPSPEVLDLLRELIKQTELNNSSAMLVS